MELIIENREDFLNFIQDFFLMNRELPELIDNIKADPSEHRIHFFHNKIKNLVTEAALMDLRPLLPFFEAVSLLVGVITMDYVLSNEETLDLISTVFSLMESNFKECETILHQPETQTQKKLKCDLDPKLLVRARSFYSAQKFDDMFEENDTDASLANDIIIEYVKEGVSFISALRSNITDSANQKSGVEQLRHLLSMVKGNGDVLMDSMPAGAENTQALYKISAIVNGMLSIIEIEVHKAATLSEDMIDLFTACLDELEILFSDLKNSNIPGESSNGVISRLKDQYCSLANQRFENKFTPDDPIIIQASEKAGSPPPSSLEESFIPIKLERLEDLVS